LLNLKQFEDIQEDSDEISNLFDDIIDAYDMYKVPNIVWNNTDEHNQYVKRLIKNGLKIQLGIKINQEDYHKIYDILDVRDKVKISKVRYVLGDDSRYNILDFLQQYWYKKFHCDEVFSKLFKTLHSDTSDQLKEIKQIIKSNFNYNCMIEHDIKILHGVPVYFIINIRTEIIYHQYELSF